MHRDRPQQQMTIKDIARMAGVSSATVSNVLNGTGRVSKSTIERVSKIVERANFNLNASARTLRQKVSRLIAIIVPGVEYANVGANPFYWEFVNGVSDVMDRNGFNVILKGVSEEADISVIQERDLDGVIVVGAYESSQFTSKMIASGIPVVFVDSYLSQAGVHLVNLDDRYGAYLATRHLIGLGHSKVLFVSGPLLPNGVDHERFQGYQRALVENGCPVDASACIQTNVTIEDGRVLAHRLAYSMQGYTGIVTSGDVLALGLIRGFHECGISVPRDVSVVGFDDLSQSAYAIPSITTIHQDVFEKGNRAGHLLFDLINGRVEKESQHIKLTPTLIVRESSATPHERVANGSTWGGDARGE